MRVDPAVLELQTKQDVIDYITLGFVPKRSDARDVFLELRNPGSSLINLNCGLDEDESRDFAAIMERVYENVAATQKVAAALCGFTGILGFMIGRRLK